MKRPVILWVLLSIFLLILGIWLWQSSVYPYPIYREHQTDEVVEQYDREAGYLVESELVWQPDNPLWVDLTQRWAPLALLLLFLSMVGVEGIYQSKKLQRMRRNLDAYSARQDRIQRTKRQRYKKGVRGEKPL